MKISEQKIEEYFKNRLFLTSLDEAVTLIEKRSKDHSLRTKIESYLDDDVPDYFRNKPIGYLARHVATPNFETLHFLDICQKNNLPAFIGQDPDDIFVTNNDLKKALGKLPIHTSNSIDDPNFSYTTVVDFNTTQGKAFKDIKTTWGQNLIEFHNNLFTHFFKKPVNIFDDSAWIKRQHRGDLLAHYKKFLSLLVVHGVMFEYYLRKDPQELKFVREILIPAFIYIEEEFGHKPLIVSLTKDEDEGKDWYGYPALNKNLLPQVTPFVRPKKYGLKFLKRYINQIIRF